MTEAAKRDLSPEEGVNEDIASDDPLFELSQIMGIDDSVASEPNVEIDPQIDLEEALLAELAAEPEMGVADAPAVDPAPTAESLEDELTSMLGDTVSVASEVPAPEIESEAEIADIADDADLVDQTDDELEAAQLSEAVTDTDGEMVAASLSPEALASTEFETSPAENVDPEGFDTAPTDVEEDMAAQVAGDVDEPADTVDSDEADALLAATEAEIDLEKDFAAFFEEELPDTPIGLSVGEFEEPVAEQSEEVQTEAVAEPEAVAFSELETPDPIEALAEIAADDFDRATEEGTAEADFEPAAQEQFDAVLEEDPAQEPAAEFVEDQSEVVEDSVEIASADAPADEEAVRSGVSDLDAGIDEIFGVNEVAETTSAAAEPELPAAPVLETTDMSAYEAANAIEVDVPELPDLENEFVAAFDHDNPLDEVDAEAQTDDGSSDVAAAIGATVAAAGATVLSRRAGETAMDADEEAFDETRFEAELARDMEFVSHDLKLADEGSAEIENELEDQEFAAAAAAQKPAKRGLMIAAILGCCAIAGAVGLFAYSGGADSGSDAPVLVEASEEPVKIAPENPGGVEVPNQDRAVFAENVVVPEQEALVPAAEEPIDIAAVPETALPSSLNGGEVAQKGDDRLVPEATETTSATDEIGALLAPRKVRTLVVRPDGTLVERPVVPTPEPVAEATPEPVQSATIEAAPEPAAPAVAEVTPEASTPTAAETSAQTPVEVVETQPSTPEIVTPEVEPTTTASAVETTAPTAEAQSVNEAVAEIAAAPVATPTTEQTEVAAVAAPEAAPAANNAATSPNFAAPNSIADRPNDQPLNIVNQPAAAPATETAAAPAAPAQAAASSPFSVQLASLPSQELAQDAASNLSRQFSNVIGNRGLTIREAQIEGRGTFYRIRVGASDRADANRLCSSIKSAGGDCFVTR